MTDVTMDPEGTLPTLPTLPSENPASGKLVAEVAPPLRRRGATGNHASQPKTILRPHTDSATVGWVFDPDSGERLGPAWQRILSQVADEQWHQWSTARTRTHPGSNLTIKNFDRRTRVDTREIRIVP